MEKLILRNPSNSEFESVDGIRNYLCRQRGSQPVPIAKWWNDRLHDSNPESSQKEWINETFLYLSAFAERCRIEEHTPRVGNMFDYDKETLELLRQRERFVARFGDLGERTMKRLDNKVIRNPYRDAFKSNQHLIDDSEVFVTYPRLSQVDSKATSEAVSYLVEFARRERDLRQGSQNRILNPWKNKGKGKGPSTQRNSTVSDHQGSSIPAMAAGNLDHDGQMLLERLAADVSLNPFSEHFDNPSTFCDYLRSPGPQISDLTEIVDQATTENIGQYITSLAADQRNVQDPQTIANLVEGEDTENMLSPVRSISVMDLINHIDTVSKQHGLDTPEYVQEETAVSQSSEFHADSTDREMENFARSFSSKNRGRAATGFLQELEEYTAKDSFDSAQFRVGQTADILSQNWPYFKTLKRKRAAFAENVERYAEWLAEKGTRASRRNTAYQNYTESLPSSSDNERWKRELIEWNQFQLDFRDRWKGFGEKGRQQLERLTIFIDSSGLKDKTSWLEYTTKEGIRSILTQPRWRAFLELEKTDTSRAERLLEFGVWYTNERISGKERENLILKQPVLEHEMREYKRLNGVKASENHTVDHSESSLGNLHEQSDDEGEDFGEAEMRSHRLMLFGLSAVPSTSY
ncbi:uncharacterized protein I206_102971 [Kwoniella pini CBS 10737]|uniref:Uncharacterized protein n=1 Tax=Kwoniella pini CBS 10737 TaxID=1296096 RepID=A0A1B9I6U2_9TREE|nr:uncharacterized protein I206_03324 [Kwoniella pini CBS 10737]OCF51257.1 hypothetical protein I206_03324 [Kwoniella pini CBS 10737]